VSPLPQNAFVTGASAGLGRAIAERLRAAGVNVWGTARAPARLADLAETDAPGDFHPVTLDLAAADAAVDAYRQAVTEAGGFDLVINNAGFGRFGEFATTEFESWQEQLETMVIATSRLVHAQWADLMAAGRGTLVNVSSLATEYLLPFMSGYNMAKAGLSALSESLMLEGAGRGVKVIDFRPGDFRTDFNATMQTDAAGRMPPEAGPAGRAWRKLEEHLRAGPLPAQAAADLWRAVRRGRSGVVRTGGFFQTMVAPLGVRLLPGAWRRRLHRGYYGLD